MFKGRQNRAIEPLGIILTGAATGLGRALARRLYATTQHRVLVTARDHHLADLRSEFGDSNRFLIRPLDVTVNSDRRQVIHDALVAWRKIDVLINNAGICYRSAVEHMDDPCELEQMNTNYLGPMSLIRLAIPAMRENGSGKIINISSVSGALGMPTMASYSASKHALEGSSESLWYELKSYGINVSVIQPGFIRSSSFEKVKVSQKANLSAALDGPFSDLYECMRPFVARLMKLSFHSPADISNTILKVIESKNPPLWISGTYDSALFYLLKCFVPRNWFHKLMYQLLPGSAKWGHRHSKANRDLTATPQ